MADRSPPLRFGSTVTKQSGANPSGVLSIFVWAARVTSGRQCRLLLQFHFCPVESFLGPRTTASPRQPKERFSMNTGPGAKVADSQQNVRASERYDLEINLDFEVIPFRGAHVLMGICHFGPRSSVH